MGRFPPPLYRLLTRVHRLTKSWRNLSFLRLDGEQPSNESAGAISEHAKRMGYHLYYLAVLRALHLQMNLHLLFLLLLLPVLR